MMKWVPARVARLGHRWLALFVGIQLVIWSASGLYMTAVDLDFIHGDPLVRNLTPALQSDRIAVAPDAVRQRYPDLYELALRALPHDGQPVYELLGPDGITLLDASTGAVLSPLPASLVTAIARGHYAGRGEVERVALLERDPPIELQTRALPLWRIDFDDWLDTTLYIHPDSGRLVVRRHRFWRWFDLLWSLHIMDYWERSDVNNGLLRTATIVSLVLVGSGAWLVAYAFRWRRRRGGAR
jgi:hypothetical protein